MHKIKNFLFFKLIFQSFFNIATVVAFAMLVSVLVVSCSSNKTTKHDVETILADIPQANPYIEHLPAMPDDNCIKIKINPIGGTLGKIFCDSNHLHLQAAQALGLKPIETLKDAWELKRPIIQIQSCREYYLDDLTHSVPYLVPEAATLLSEIGSRFNQELFERGGGSYRIKVTSVTRTPASVNKLKHVNRNASQASAHQFATTFDISYSKFICDSITVNRTQEDLKNLLAEVLFELRDKGRCYVKHERKQGCFHITVRQ